MALISKLTAIGDAVRAQTGGTEAIALLDMADEIAAAASGDLVEPLVQRTVVALRDSQGLVGDAPDYALHSCASLWYVELPQAATVGYYAFGGCSALSMALLPAAASVDDYAFYYDKALAEIDLSSCESIGKYSFAGCSALVAVDLPVCTSLGTAAFGSCTALESLTLRADTVCSLAAKSAISTSKIGKGTGYVYVPEELLEEYKAATYWSDYADQILAIGD